MSFGGILPATGGGPRECDCVPTPGAFGLNSDDALKRLQVMLSSPGEDHCEEKAKRHPTLAAAGEFGYTAASRERRALPVPLEEAAGRAETASSTAPGHRRAARGHRSRGLIWRPEDRSAGPRSTRRRRRQE